MQFSWGTVGKSTVSHRTLSPVGYIHLDGSACTSQDITLSQNVNGENSKR